MCYGPASLLNHVCGDDNFHFRLQHHSCARNMDAEILAGIFLIVLFTLQIFLGEEVFASYGDSYFHSNRQCLNDVCCGELCPPFEEWTHSPDLHQIFVMYSSLHNVYYKK